MENCEPCSGCRAHWSSSAALISRRSLLLGFFGTAIAACAAPVIRTPKEEVAQFPLIDVHSHYVPDRYQLTEFLKAMDAAGIRRMVVMSGLNLPASLAQNFPNRFIATYVGMPFMFRQESGVIKDGTSAEEVDLIGTEVEGELKTGLYRGLGEFTTYSRPFPGVLPPTRISPNSPLIRRLLELSGRYGVPINIHCDDYGAQEMVSALRAYPKTRVVWAHTGSYLPPSAIRDILRDHPNVAFDLSTKTRSFPFGYSTYPLFGFGGLAESWRQLFEVYPDRFMVAFDFFTPDQLRLAQESGEFFREMLTQLTPATARKISHENAERTFGLG